MPPPGVCLNIMDKRHKKNGLGSLANSVRFRNQDYEQLKKFCVVRGVRFIDDEFPPDHNSIGTGTLDDDTMSRVKWLRPRDMSDNPAFIVDGVSRFDFGQGILGNCWFLASIGALTFQKHILEQVVPMKQSFVEEYTGLFHFKFWRFGKWVDVVIDDKLPTVDGRLIFVHSKTPNEFWPALLEKAYAKVCGSYGDMNAGTCAEALMDFTGGVHMSFQLKEAPPNLWDLMIRAAASKSLMGCGTPQGETSENTVCSNGLVRGHAYAVTGVTKVMSNNQPVNLVRLWNPWGTGEWKGDWSDTSSKWETVSAVDKQTCVSVRDDGEFWMTMSDFSQFYSDVDICCLCPDFLDGNSSCHWKSSFHDGRWVAGTTAGGCQNFDTFWTNPQYRIEIQGLEGECEDEGGDNNMLVSLMQKPDKRNRRMVKNIHIGFTIFKVPEEFKNQKGKFPDTFFKTHPVAAQVKNYMNAREVMEFFRLSPGEYLIVPSTFKPNETASFILTILSKAETHTHENSGDHDHHEVVTKPKPADDGVTEEDKKKLFRQYSDSYEEVGPEQLQKILNEQILKDDTKYGGFSLDSCRSMVALMDTSITGKLNGSEFVRLWKKASMYKEIFARTDVSGDGTLQLGELRNAIMASGTRVSDDMLNLMALRYGDANGNLTLDSFIGLVLRMDCMAKIFKQLSDGVNMSLQEAEWMYISMYT